MDAKDFRTDPYGFMQQNVVIVNLNSSDVKSFSYDPSTKSVVRPGSDFLIEATVRPIPNATVTGCAGEAFSLRKADSSVPDDEKRKIYFVPYAQNSLCGTILSRKAQWVFTATMDGCSFGVGSQPGDGTAMVVHANAGTSGGSGGGREQQVKMQTRLLESTFGMQGHTLGSVVDPSSYMVDAGGTPTTGADRIRSTTFGHRVHGIWVFYTLRYRVSGSGLAPQYVHEGVHAQ